MPVLFVGHGSPHERDRGQRIPPQLAGPGRANSAPDGPPPQLILCISAHWLTAGWWLTGMDQPKTIHDFGGFPQELFDQQYPAPGAPAVARAISRQVRQPRLGSRWAWTTTNGAWTTAPGRCSSPCFPQADIPVMQLSMDYSRPPAEHYALGRQLKGLRERGVLIVGSGNIVHNLRTMPSAARPTTRPTTGRSSSTAPLASRLRRATWTRCRTSSSSASWRSWRTRPTTTTCRCCTRPVRRTPGKRRSSSTPISRAHRSRCAR